MSNPKVLLVGWDSADWKVASPLMDQGEMPLLRKLVDCGVMGNLATLQPVLSPMLWTSIATGKRAYDHGVFGFTEVDAITGRVKPVTAASRRCKALWNILSEKGLKSHVVSWFATHGEQVPNGIVVSNLFQAPTAGPGQVWPPAPRGTIWPETHAEQLNELRVSPEEIDAEMVGMFVPRWQDVDQEKDHRLGHLRMHLSECLSVQAAATWILENQEWDFLAVYYRAIDELCHHFMPFHPPKLDGVPEEMFDIYKDVVNSSYRLHDFMLARLVALAGPDVHVILVSDHGFHSDHLRPKFVPRVPAGITVWHRSQGVIAASGPQFSEDELIYGASLLDITPTVLSLFGLPVGEDMEGKVLLQAFRDPPEIETIPSWEATGVKFESGAADLTESESQALLDQFAALGYIDKPEGDKTQHSTMELREHKWVLARAYIDGRRPHDALPLLEELYEEKPDRTDFAQVLARCQIDLGLYDEARRTIDATLETFSNRSTANLLRAQVALELGEHQKALDLLEEARGDSPRNPEF